jgi:dTDP-4-dehydrorhamnose reductase
VAANAIKGVPTSEFRTAAKRPLNSRLDCGKLKREFNLNLPHWQVGVERMLTEILDKRA